MREHLRRALQENVVSLRVTSRWRGRNVESLATYPPLHLFSYSPSLSLFFSFPSLALSVCLSLSHPLPSSTLPHHHSHRHHYHFALGTTLKRSRSESSRVRLVERGSPSLLLSKQSKLDSSEARVFRNVDKSASPSCHCVR